MTHEAWTFLGILVTALGGMGVAWLARGQDASARKRQTEQADQAMDAEAASPLIMQMLQHVMTEQSTQITRQAEQASDQQERIEQLTRLVYQQGEEMKDLNERIADDRKALRTLGKYLDRVLKEWGKSLTPPVASKAVLRLLEELEAEEGLW